MTGPTRRRTIVQLALASGAGAAATVLGVRGAGATGEPMPEPRSLESAFQRRPYSPYAERSFATHVYWGDTHLHTGFSMDAGAFGARLTPRDAYRFAKGEELISATRQPVRLARPLDFLVVADHSDGMGFFPRVIAGEADVMANPDGRRWHNMVRAGGEQGVAAAIQIIRAFGAGALRPPMFPVPGTRAFRSAWDETMTAAEEANQPGRFTAFIGFEWTSNTGGNNLHRVVIFRDGGDRAGQVEPYTTLRPAGSDDPKDLWRYMAAYEERTGGQVLAIAHNGNLSNGRMFPVIDTFTGAPFDRAYAETRARWEPLYEVTQMKGDGETHPFLSPNDEFADFERWDVGNLDLTELKTREMLPNEYARSALRLGLLLEQRLGVNPYRFGMIGSTDSHTGLATADDDNFFGKHAGAEPSGERAGHLFMQSTDGRGRLIGWQQVASGYAGVWARENTRAALFDAMQRKEVYATTGPRMIVRFFGGWEFEEADAHGRSPAIAGYSKGVPMGGDLGEAPRGRAPAFLVAALKDPIGANLDRIQVVKGWLDAAGQTHERVFDVAWSGGRRPDGQGRLPAVGSTVDVAAATWTNTIGAPELITVWRDPEFDPAQRAVYYARVIEIPTPRWTAYDARYFGVTMPPNVPMSTQERAYTSPIWYSPR
ncbi:MAG TPA: DUF3604 domain-containing protein [Acetobacteraceae bacterium]|nr:DUF3604 domain-containing protein [Acetobacteraceae bacterium]